MLLVPISAAAWKHAAAFGGAGDFKDFAGVVMVFLFSFKYV